MAKNTASKMAGKLNSRKRNILTAKEREAIMANTKNWVGLPIHFTDSYVHWNDKDPKARMLELRALYERISHPDAFDQEALEDLLQAAYEAGQNDERDSHAGVDL